MIDQEGGTAHPFTSSSWKPDSEKKKKKKINKFGKEKKIEVSSSSSTTGGTLSSSRSIRKQEDKSGRHFVPPASMDNYLCGLPPGAWLGPPATEGGSSSSSWDSRSTASLSSGGRRKGILAGVAVATVLGRGEENLRLNIETFHETFEGNPARLPRGACTAGSHVGAPLKTTFRHRTQAPYKTDQ